MRSNFLKSKWFMIAGSVILVLFLFSLGKEVYKKYQIRREIKGLESEILRLQSQNQDLSELLAYFRTPAYKERQARSLLNLKKPGEFAFALPSADEAGPAGTPEAAPQSEGPNFLRWREYFFKKSDADQ